MLKTTRSLFALVWGAALTCSLALAADESGPSWLTKTQERALSDSVPPPPAPGSDADKADLATILQVQGARTAAMVAEANRDAKIAYTLFQPVYGDSLTEENSPKFHEMLKNVMKVTWVVNETAKEKYRRLRPFKGHPDQVHALFDVSGFSYPSGHSMGSYTLAVVLGAVFPDKAQAFLDRAGQIAQSRVDAGVHYSSDIAEGEVLGKATGAAILASSDFQKDLAAVQMELKK